MGGSNWSGDDYTSRTSHRVATRGAVFAHDADVRTGKVAATVHATLDPKILNLKVRESRDSATHPESNAIMVGLDVTGSMSAVIKTIHEKLPTLMGILTSKGYIAHPQILFGAIGDATCDKYPLQIGQFESGAEMEGDLGNFILEEGGGGQNTESYELFAYVGARKTSIDCFEKRGKKGYCFIIGDENSYSNVKSREVHKYIGDTLETDIPNEVIFKELQEKYVVFYVLPSSAANGRHGRAQIIAHWKKLIGDEHVLILEEAKGVAELIATQIGLCEGTTDVDTAAKDLKDSGTSLAVIKAVTGSVSKAYTGGELAKIPTGALTPSGDSSSVTRL